MVLVSDGVSSVVSDEEVVGLARGGKDPKDAADRILAFAEEMGSEDNATAIVVPLAGWGKIEGPDKTKDFRQYRLRQMSEFFCAFIYISNSHIYIYQLGARGSAECDEYIQKHNLFNHTVIHVLLLSVLKYLPILC